MPFLSPFQAEQLAKSSYIFVDVTYTGNESFPYLLNVFSLNEKTLLYNAVGRVLCNKQDKVAYGKAFKEIFAYVTSKFPDFKDGESRGNIGGFRQCTSKWLETLSKIS